ncbi:MAG TPA: hypothetical protein PLV59_00080 [Candidatus Dojkabacteria bacterium]|nr:hypothetical protein [Candidatus Dojkabacteria bacterium]
MNILRISQKIVSVVFFISVIFLFNKSITEAACWPTSSPQLEAGSHSPNCGNTNGGNAEGETGGYNCGNYVALGGAYGCYWHSYACDTPCGSGGGGGGGGGTPACDWSRVDCPAGTVVDYNQEIGRICGRISYCPNAGTAQQNLGCCGGGWVDTDDCWTTPSGVERCEQEFVCRRNTIATYRCVPLAPPVEVTLSMTTNGETMGCTAVAGYVGKNANNIVKVTSSIPTSFAGGTISDMRNWFGGTPVVTDAVSSTVSQALANNGQFGIMVRKTGANWTDIYAPSKYATNGTVGASIQSWVRIGSVGSGYRGEIKGSNGRSLASISNVSVTNSGANTVLTYDIAFYSDLSGLQVYENATSKTYQIHGAAKFSNGTTAPNWTNPGDTFVLDLTSPTQEDLSFTVASNTLVDLLWRFTDVDPSNSGNGMARVIGNASRIKAGRVDGPIDDLTSGVLDYVLGSGGTDLPNLYTSTNNLWRVNGSTTRTERIDIKTNEGGALDFAVYAFDKACNRTLGSIALPLGDPWVITKAGVVYSEGGSVYETPTLAYTSTTERLSNDNYWNLPFAFYKSDADLSTEILASSGSNLGYLVNAARLRSVRLMNERDLSNRSGYWFSRLSAKLDSEVEDFPSDFVVVSHTGNLNAPARSTLLTDGINTCVSSKYCVAEVLGNLTLNSNYVCDAKTLFVVEGTININPDVTSNSAVNGCMFLGKGDVVINPGTYKSTGATYPKYDILESLIITDGAITVAYGDSGRPHRDGLKVVGSLIAFGGTKSFIVDRSLTLMDANNFPSVAVHFDARYLNFATKYFGGDTEGFKSEVGFKP